MKIFTHISLILKNTELLQIVMLNAEEKKLKNQPQRKYLYEFLGYQLTIFRDLHILSEKPLQPAEC